MSADPASRFIRWISRTDHKHLGVMYILSALVFFLAGGMEAMAMRTQLALPNLKFLTPQLYNQVFTMHGTTMIFLVVIPVLTGFGIYLVPLMIGASDLAFPRLAALGFVLQVCGGVLLYVSFARGTAPDAGWFSYAPLTEKAFSPGPGLDYWAIALLLLAASAVISAIDLVVTIATLRTPGMTMRLLPMFVWMVLITSLMIVFSQPVLAASLVMLLGDRLLHARFFDPTLGGAPLLWQHYFRIFGHPEVYIMILPVFGMISEVIPVFSRKPLFGYPLVAASSVAIAFLSYGVWAHHMFAVALGRTFLSAFAASSMLIAVPTGVKIFNWTATMWAGSIRFTTSMLFAIAFLLEFTIGGLSGVVFATVPIDWQLTDSYFVVAHIHYVLFGGTIFGLFAGIYYWFPKMTGHMLDESIGRWHFWLVVIGFNTTFFVQHLLGLLGMPRRVYSYPDLPGLGALNLTSTIGAGVLTMGILVFCCNILVSLRFGQSAGDNPWNAWTLEWAASSPATLENFEIAPPVSSRRPLWDLSHPESPDGSVKFDRRISGTFVQPPANLGMALFLVSDSVFFFMLILAFVIFRSQSVNTAAETLNLSLTSVYTVCLSASSFTIWRASRTTVAQGDGTSRLWLAATILLTSVFFLGQGGEYLCILRGRFTVSQGMFGTTFFILTGVHGIHVLIGILLLAGLLWTQRPVGDPAVSTRLDVQPVALFWYFVGSIWIVIFLPIFMDVSVTMIGRLLTAWDWEPTIVVGCCATMASYCFAARGRGLAKTLSFLGGVLLLLLDLVSPLDRLGDEYLLSAHILQHFFMGVIVPPLLLLGIQRSWVETALRHSAIRKLERYVGRPTVSWMLGVGTMLVWHVPALFNAALSSDDLQIFQHLSFLVTGTIYWWPILSPVEEARPSALGSISYLFTACLACSLLGAALTFGPTGLYPAYLHPSDALGILPLVRDGWGLNPRNDQELGGLLMWVPGCFVYLSGILWTLARWYRMPEYAAREEPAR